MNHESSFDTKNMKVGIAYDVFFEKHLTGSGHPEQPARTARIYKELAKTGLLDDAIPVETRACDEEILKFAHQPAYLAQAKKTSSRVFPHSPPEIPKCAKIPGKCPFGLRALRFALLNKS